ncbi:Coiled-coil and C2 domain-containing protein 1-like [Amphibalanus amphitrite]|uniref:Coiled-coil and C2 domain-containing protein 1-like n=1 Tax=Amphibalanus amphitrite TaxID=1232801 RepID=A0A6A4VMF1_AMPAM|nr:Coiled-coil and C2 domain-containing protein 1-like [Amphibalanus amphitrite]
MTNNVSTTIGRTVLLRCRIFQLDGQAIVEGRRTVKGKLEVKMRMRKPAVSDQVEQIKEKWLVIDKL